MSSPTITAPKTHQSTSSLLGMDEILAWAKMLRTHHYRSFQTDALPGVEVRRPAIIDR